MKKKAASKTPITQEKELYNAFLQRFKTACESMVGKGFFEDIPKHHLPQLFNQRVSPLKLEFAPGIFTKEEEMDWHTRFRLRLTDLSVQTIEDRTIPVADYFREGYLLANYADSLFRQDRNLILHERIAETYGVYSQIFFKAAEKIMLFVNSLCVIHSDFQGKVLLSNYTATGMLGNFTASNKIKLSIGKLPKERLELDDQARDITALCWTDFYGKLKQITVVPFKLGFPKEFSQPIPVYFQQHLVTRLTERLSLPGGLLLYILQGIFHDNPDDFYLLDGNLLPFTMMEKKLGYLVVELLNGKMIIRTFLFLTNDGTPEGRKLAKMTRLKKLDKQYFGIDTMSGFSSLNTAGDPLLRSLFIEAGCGDLLDLDEINGYRETALSKRNVDGLLRYLHDSPFMKWK